MGLRERLVASAAEIRTRSQRLVELNVQLLTAELKKKGQVYGSAIGMLVGAGVLALYALGFALTTIAVVLHIWLALWLSLLIVTVVLLLIVLILALVGRSRLRERQIAVAGARDSRGQSDGRHNEDQPAADGERPYAAAQRRRIAAAHASACRKPPTDTTCCVDAAHDAAVDAAVDAAHHAARGADAYTARRSTLERRGALMADTGKTPQRSPDRIAGDIANERAQLGKAYDALRGELSEAAAADNQTIAAGRRALLLGPAMAVAVAATVGGLVAGLRTLSDQSKKK